MLPQEPYKKFAAITLYSAVAIALIYFIFNYLWSAILPFIISYIFAECFKPIVKYSEQNKKFPKKSFIIFMVILTFFAVFSLIYAILRQLFLEATQLSNTAKAMVEQINSDDIYAAEIIEKINKFVPFIDIRPRLWDIRSNMDEEIWSLIISFGDKISGVAFSFIGNAAKFIPNMLFTTVVIIVATYYFAVDRIKINCFFLSLFPKNIRKSLKSVKNLLSETVGKYLRAYGLLFLITFAQLLLLFWIMGINYAFILAIVIALVDILPVVGTGTVLIPWAVISFITENLSRGIWLLVGYGVIVVTRQVVEPKIVGKFIGLSPIAALASMYIGLKLIGIAGLFTFPIGAIILKKLLERKNNVIFAP